MRVFVRLALIVALAQVFAAGPAEAGSIGAPYRTTWVASDCNGPSPQILGPSCSHQMDAARTGEMWVRANAFSGATLPRAGGGVAQAHIGARALLREPADHVVVTFQVRVKRAWGRVDAITSVPVALGEARTQLNGSVYHSDCRACFSTQAFDPTVSSYGTKVSVAGELVTLKAHLSPPEGEVIPAGMLELGLDAQAIANIGTNTTLGVTNGPMVPWFSSATASMRAVLVGIRIDPS